MENGFLLILVGVISMIFGFALGMGVATLRLTSSKAKKPAPRNAPRPATRQAAQTATRVTQQTMPQPSPQTTPQAEPEFVPDAVSSTATELPVVSPESVSFSPSKAAETTPPFDLPLESTSQSGALRRPTMTPITVISRALQADVRAPSPPSKSIAAQVDEILQEMLKKSPLAARAIKLMELPGKGMVVMVGLNQYDGVDAVPDEDIRKLIRSAVAEWERQATQSAP